MGLHLCSLRNLSSFYDSLNSSPGILTESDFSLSYSSPCQPKESDLSLACHFQNRSPAHTIIKFITNYIKGRKAYTTFRNKTSTQRQFKTGIPQGGILSPTLFKIYTSDTPTPQAPVKLTTYADDITITSTHNDINIAITNI